MNQITGIIGVIAARKPTNHCLGWIRIDTQNVPETSSCPAVWVSLGDQLVNDDVTLAEKR
jgi:hypothetical protein